MIEEGKEIIEMPEMSLGPRYSYSCFISAVDFVAAAAAAESIADVRTWARLDDTGMVRSSDMARRPRSAEARELLASCC